MSKILPLFQVLVLGKLNLLMMVRFMAFLEFVSLCRPKTKSSLPKTVKHSVASFICSYWLARILIPISFLCFQIEWEKEREVREWVCVCPCLRERGRVCKKDIWCFSVLCL